MERRNAPMVYPDWRKVPEHLYAGLRNYVLFGVPPGHFLKKVICNDLAGAVASGDAYSLAGIAHIVAWLQYAVPDSCHGSPEKYTSWCAKPKEELRAIFDALPPLTFG